MVPNFPLNARGRQRDMSALIGKVKIVIIRQLGPSTGHVPAILHQTLVTNHDHSIIPLKLTFVENLLIQLFVMVFFVFIFVYNTVAACTHVDPGVFGTTID